MYEQYMFSAQCGQRALVGKVNMDRESPDNYIEDTSKSIADTEQFIEFVEGMKVTNLFYSIM